MDLREHGRHSLGGRRRRGQEADLRAVLLEGAVGDKTMEVDIQAEVAAKSLGHREYARVLCC